MFFCELLISWKNWTFQGVLDLKQNPIKLKGGISGILALFDHWWWCHESRYLCHLQDNSDQNLHHWTYFIYFKVCLESIKVPVNSSCHYLSCEWNWFVDVTAYKMACILPNATGTSTCSKPKRKYCNDIKTLLGWHWCHSVFYELFDRQICCWNEDKSCGWIVSCAKEGSEWNDLEVSNLQPW